MEKTPSDVEIQRRYYSETAHQYNDMHVQPEDEHFFALSFVNGAIDHFDFKTVLDVGSGTGRALLYIKERRPDIAVKGIEPVSELREMGYKAGLSPDELVEGDATGVHFNDNQFDLVTEFGVLHHVNHPHRVVAEMLRVAKRAIFISDTNNFGHGNYIARTTKQLLDSLGLWRAADFIKTGGKGYRISEGDGLSYSYSVFNDYKLIKSRCKSVHILNTVDGDINPYRSADHIALLGIKK